MAANGPMESLLSWSSNGVAALPTQARAVDLTSAPIEDRHARTRAMNSECGPWALGRTLPLCHQAAQATHVGHM